MTRFARGGSENKKRPLEASSWTELKAKKLKKDRCLDEIRHGHDSLKSKGHTPEVTPGSSRSHTVSINKAKKDKTENVGQRRPKATEEFLQEALHKEQRSEERRLKRIKKRESDVVCYNCRESGHQMSECPEIRTDMEQGTGICFKCGSTEHTSTKCSVKVPRGQFPYAKCFVCGETGHLSKQCPDNPRGLYPMGGCCKICESVEHYQRDCPQMQEKQGIGGYRLKTLGKLENPDAEVEEAIPMPKPVKKTGPKLVKF